MKTYTIQEMREMLDKYIHKNSDGWGHNELLEVRNYINYFLSWLEKEEEKTVPKIEEIQDAYSHDTNLDELSRKLNEIIRYIYNK